MKCGITRLVLIIIVGIIIADNVTAFPGSGTETVMEDQISVIAGQAEPDISLEDFMIRMFYSSTSDDIQEDDYAVESWMIDLELFNNKNEDNDIELKEWMFDFSYDLKIDEPEMVLEDWMLIVS